MSETFQALNLTAVVVPSWADPSPPARSRRRSPEWTHRGSNSRLPSVLPRSRVAAIGHGAAPVSR
jgi:hypothetical protein